MNDNHTINILGNIQIYILVPNKNISQAFLFFFSQGKSYEKNLQMGLKKNSPFNIPLRYIKIWKN